jgi:hypothetical protein
MAATIQSFNTANPGNASSITVTKPTGLAVGDLMIFHYAYNDASDTPDTISGWTHEVNNATFGLGHTGLQWKIADSGDVAASNFTLTFSGTVGSPVAGLIRIDGYASAGLLNDSGNLQPNTSSPTYTNTVTPTTPNALILFFTANNEGKAVNDDYAIVTDNPSWSELYDVQGSTAASVALGYATRTETTATGNSSCSLAGGSGTVDSYGILVAIPSITNVTVSPSVITIVTSVQSPTITGGATVSPAVIEMTASMQDPAITITPAKWLNQNKSSVPSYSNENKSSAPSYTNQSKSSAPSWTNQEKTP